MLFGGGGGLWGGREELSFYKVNLKFTLSQPERIEMDWIGMELGTRIRENLQYALSYHHQQKKKDKVSMENITKNKIIINLEKICNNIHHHHHQAPPPSTINKSTNLKSV